MVNPYPANVENWVSS